jgi:hypothetical protein
MGRVARLEAMTARHRRGIVAGRLAALCGLTGAVISQAALLAGCYSFFARGTAAPLPFGLIISGAAFGLALIALAKTIPRTRRLARLDGSISRINRAAHVEVIHPQKDAA